MDTSIAAQTKFAFTFQQLTSYFKKAIECGYDVITCKDYVACKANGINQRLLINRVDIDVSVKKAERLAIIFNELGVKATFFVRLHANEYNPFSFENYRILKFIRESGHEIGYHSEIIDQAVIWNEAPINCLKRDIAVLQTMLDVKVVGVASHGGMTGLNNLDFWKDHKPVDLGILYEAYDQEPAFDLFHQSLYVSDSSWTYWKCYQQGKQVPNDHRHLGEHVESGAPLIYSLIHPETYFDRHFYE